MMRTLISMLIVASAMIGLCFIAPAASARGVPPVPQIVGGWKPIKNVSNPHIQDLGRWAVSEHDKASRDGLAFNKVVSGEYQIVAGTNYKLVIRATRGDDGGSATYGAVVYQKLDKTQQLISFAPAN